MAADDSRTYWASWGRVERIPLSPARKKASPSPSWSEVTFMGGGCWDRPKGNPPFAWRHFDRCSPIERPTIGDPRLEAEKRVHEGETRGAESPPVPSPPHQKTQI
jgi:hypothetical protein